MPNDDLNLKGKKKKTKKVQDSTSKSKKEKTVFGRKSHVTNEEDRARITITLSKQTLKKMDSGLVLNDSLIESLGNFPNRSHLIEQAITLLLNQHKDN